ncbi:DnaJ-domain-containing protein [Testicularia cyperi]|uniref:DnaJ-domain-containing protein n=1 Tax=Testicularia cyperi TaxID=1882483 RepID=A0A317XQZ2_9BASI|nr:DnaJ-domain-containing protein [Testicularia cyperi]
MSSSTADLQDSFRVLGLPSSASEAEIKKAYRKLSLRYHPDKAGKDVDPVEAANRFHRINLAYETLMDPAARAKAVQQTQEETARRQRQEQYADRRKQMADELERSEQQAYRKREDADRRQRERQAKIDLLQQEARSMLLEKQRQAEKRRRDEDRAASAQRRKAEEQALRRQPPPLDPLDRTIRVRFPSTQLAQMTGQPTQTHAPTTMKMTTTEELLSTPLASALAAQFGPLEHLQFQLPSSGKKMKREITALASFTELSDAWQAVLQGGEMRCTGLLEDCYMGWARYEEKRREDGVKEKVYFEPARIRWIRKRGIARPEDIPTDLNAFSSEIEADADVAMQDEIGPASATGQHNSARHTYPQTYSRDYEEKTLDRMHRAQLAQLGTAPSTVQAA